MAFVKQRSGDDCGVCCLAMLLDVSYEDAKDLLFGKGYLGKLRTKTIEIVAAVDKCDRAKVIRRRLKVNHGKSWGTVPDNSLVKIRREGSANWHWVVYRKGKVYDPALGVFKPSAFDKPPSSFIEILPRVALGFCKPMGNGLHS